MANARFAGARADQRTRLIKLIHVGRRELKLDEDSYRGIVAKHARGKTSASDCTVLELERIMAHLKAAGFKVTKPAGVKPDEARRLDTSGEASKARAVWLLLYQIGAVRNPAESALAAYARRQIGVDDLRWAGPRIGELIEALKAWVARVLPEALSVRLARMQQAGLVTADLDVSGLLMQAAPNLGPATFDALRAAWEYLNTLDQEAKG